MTYSNLRGLPTRRRVLWHPFLKEPARIAFLGYRPGTAAIALAVACGLGQHPKTIVGETRFRRLYALARRGLKQVDLSEAQVVVFPHAYTNNIHTRAVAKAAKQYGLPCLFFLPNETNEPTNIDYGIVYRVSLYGSRQRSHERVMPALVDDVACESPFPVEVGTWNPQPTVGFCGYVGTPVHRLALFLLGRREKLTGLKLRIQALKELQRTEGVNCNFIPRRSFWAGAKAANKSFASSRVVVRREFLENLLNNDYSLAVRGKGNYSFRFYEVLSGSRTPLFINTDCGLPFSDYIDWRNHVVWVEVSDIRTAGLLLRQYHNSLSSEEFCIRQESNRRLWEDWLSPESFFVRVLWDAISGTPQIEGQKKIY